MKIAYLSAFVALIMSSPTYGNNAEAEVLNAIGWDMELDEPDVTIACSGVDSTGIMSAYTSHTFSVTSSVGPISDWQWEAVLPLANGAEQTLTGTSATFTLPALTDAQQYAHTYGGSVNCLIRFTGIVSGDTIRACLQTSLDLKPVILGVEVLEIANETTDERYKDVTVGVSYAGCNYVYLALEEESNPYINWYYSDLPSYTTHTFENIYSLEAAWLSVTLRNAYGSASASITVFKGTDQGVDSPSIGSQTGDSAADGYEAFTIDGRYLEHVRNMKDLKQSGYASGIYLLKTSKDGKCVTKKIKL